MFFIDVPRTVIPALDCPLSRAVEIVCGVRNVNRVQAFKLGAWKGALRAGLGAWVEALSPYLNGRKLIYDHQKAATDIPDLADAMADLVDAGIDAVIFFPSGGGEPRNVGQKQRWMPVSQRSLGVT